MKKIAFISTGGTIAGLGESQKSTGYKAGVLKTSHLLEKLKGIEKLAKVEIFELANIDSVDMSFKLWFELAHKINTLLSEDFDAVVLSHGTDSMEESAFFLSLVLKSFKPVVLVGAMRPASAMSADGIKNLYNAFILANSAKIQGVCICMNDRIFSALSVSKTHTLNLNAFSSLNSGDLGYIIDEEVKILNSNFIFKQNFELKQNLPKVDILYTYVEDRNVIVAKALFESGSEGLVMASSGCGSLCAELKQNLKDLAKKGLNIVISSRVLEGFVFVEDEEFISAGFLTPQKARILLSLALSQSKERQKLKNIFKLFNSF